MLATLAAAAAAAGAPRPARAVHLAVRAFTSAQGLAGDSVHALLEDSRGFLWVGTTAGLSRFDGHEFRTYEVSDGLPSPRIEGLLETRRGELWVTTEEGPARLDLAPGADGRAFQPLAVPAGHRASEVTEDAEGNLLVQTDTGLFRVRAGETTLAGAERVTLPAGETGYSGYPDQHGGLWLSTSRGLRHVAADGRQQLYLYPHGSPLLAIAVEARGRLWLAIGQELYVWMPPARDAGEADALARRARRPGWLGELPHRAGDVVRYVDRDESGLPSTNVWSISCGPHATAVATRNGVLRFAGGRIEVLTSAQGLPENDVLAALADRAGRLWMGTESRGLARLDDSGLRTYDTADGLVPDRISNVLEPGDGRLYAVTEGRLLHVRDGERFVDVTPRALAEVEGGWGWGDYFLRDRRGRWWIPTAAGLYRFPAVARAEDLVAARPDLVLRAGRGLPADDVFRTYEDRAGDVWVSVIATPSLVRLVGGERPQVVNEVESTPTRGAVTAFAEDGAGELWVGFYVGGLARLRHGRWESFGTRDGAPGGFVGGLHVDRGGRLWIAASSGGLARVDDPTAARPRFVRYGTAQGLATDNARCVTEDTAGRIYVGHGRGIDRLDPRTGLVRTFTIDDGLLNGTLKTCYLARDGALWFGAVHGLSRLDATVEKTARPPVVRLASLRVRGVARPLPPLGAIDADGGELPAGDGALEIGFLAIDLGGRDLRFQYRLAPAPWSPPTRARSVVFAGLAPGPYRFEVRALTGDGATSPRPATLSFRLLAPLWRRPWFLAAIAALLAALVVLADRVRVQRLVALERVRMRIASDLHDDVGASLSRINFLGEMARARLTDAPATAAEMLERIGTEATELTDATADIIWSVDPRRDDLASLVVRLRRFAGDLLDARGIRLHVELPDGLEQVLLPAEVRRALYLILKEAFHNVAKHSRARHAWLRLVIDGGELVAEVRDDGIGITADRVAAADSAGRRGLRGMRERGRQLTGRVEIDGVEGGGTRVTARVSLPARRRWRLA